MGIFNKTKFNLVLKMLIVLCISIFFVLIISFSILGGDAKHEDTYVSVIQRKYEKLKNIEEPKIVIIGGSNVGFGIDSELLEEKTGYPVVNMGLHAGFGNLFNTEIAKNHIKQGDIIILAYEYGLSSDKFEALGDLDLIMSGIDNKLEMYKDIPLKNMLEVFGNIFSYSRYESQPAGVYASASFDEQGNMIYKRESYIISDYQNKIDVYGQVNGASLLLKDDKLEYLNKLRKHVEKKGASIYFTAPVLLEDAYNGTEQELLDYTDEMERLTDIKFISNPCEYLFSSDYMYDTIYHCNDLGEKRRTEQLAIDLQKYININ